MKRIKIISGTYGHKPKDSKHIVPVSIGAIIEVDEAEANRLIGLGIAEFVTETAPKSVATDSNAVDNNGTGEKLNTNKNGSNGENDNDNSASGNLDKSQLETMTIKDLEALAAKMGIDVEKCKKKADYIEAIVAVKVDTDDNTSGNTDDDANDDEDGSGTPPALNVEPPVV